MRTWFLLLTCAAASLPLLASAQGYTLRPGPRGFDPKLNPYGETEQKSAATTDDDHDASRTTVKVELLQEGTGGALAAQEWSRTLAGLGYPARIRQPIRDDKEQVTESTRGTLRFVTVVGKLDRRGNLLFPGRTFSHGDAAQLKEWLDDLKTYGAQGSPAGQPLWGLDRPQFEAIYSALSRPVHADLAGLSLEDAVSALALPAEYRVRFTVAAKTGGAAVQSASVSRDLNGLTTGTTFAFVLREFGLGFHPARTPNGSIEFQVEPLPAEQQSGPRDEPSVLVVWPVGWEIEEAKKPASKTPVQDRDAEPPQRVRLAPGFMGMRQDLTFKNLPLPQVFADVERDCGVPVLIDRASLAASGVDLPQLKASFGPQSTSWNFVLQRTLFPHRLRHELRRDEAGHPLVWVSSSRKSL